MKIKTSELEGDALNWTVATLFYTDGRAIHVKKWPGCFQILVETRPGSNAWCAPIYDVDHGKTGPIIDEALISTCPIFVDGEFHCWKAFGHDLKYDDNGEYIEGSDHRMYGPTRLIAGLRCFVVSKLGDEVNVPEELL